MNDRAPAKSQQPIKLERTYEADVEDVWALWTTKEGFESWWGPEGFRVEVRALDLRVGGTLYYDMIADGAEQIAFMKREGMPISHETRGTFVELQAPTRLRIRHTIDFIPGLEPYDNDMLLELVAEGRNVRMIVTIEPHREPEWTQRSVAGFTSQLTKVTAALAARRR